MVKAEAAVVLEDGATAAVVVATGMMTAAGVKAAARMVASTGP